MKVLITGATGFIGRYIVKELLSEGYEVGCLVRDVEKTLRLFENKVMAYKVDFEDKKSLKKAFSDFGPDFLIHLIGILLEDKRHGQSFMRVHYLYAKKPIPNGKGIRKDKKGGAYELPWNP